ncbi:hypothetical protein V494_03397 [Pseudogymnoascus sp. VKM F-4513 (FW-928)]|nr:hypothetical protein V494_03397 [Pseudogymnoascus sp. VKM F-4513 (FW-928)]
MVVGIAKLTGPNYRVWSLVKRLLQSRGLWDVVEPLPKVGQEGEKAEAKPSASPTTAPEGVQVLEYLDVGYVRMETYLRAHGDWCLLAGLPLDEYPKRARDLRPMDELPTLDLLTGLNYRTWRKRVESLLRYEEVWDAVAEGGIEGGWASELEILHCADAAERWAKLGDIYGPRQSRLPGLLERYMEFAPRAEMTVAEISENLEDMRDDIEEIDPGSRPSLSQRRVALVGAVIRAASPDGDLWEEARKRIDGSECSYEEALDDLIGCEKEMEAEVKVRRSERYVEEIDSNGRSSDRPSAQDPPLRSKQHHLNNKPQHPTAPSSHSETPPLSPSSPPPPPSYPSQPPPSQTNSQPHYTTSYIPSPPH